MVLDDVAEEFMIKMWKMMIFELLKLEKGLV